MTTMSTAAAPISPPKDWKTRAPAPPKGTATFEGQSTLERLPVPKLEATLTKLKRSLKAIAWGEDEYRIAERRIDQFASGFGPELQCRLEKRRDEPGREHWLEEWWDAGSYNGYRDSVMVYVSYYCKQLRRQILGISLNAVLSAVQMASTTIPRNTHKHLYTALLR